MFNSVKENIRGFLDITSILTMTAIGIFSLLSDYRYFRRVKYKKDAAVSLGIGLTYIILPIVLIFITRL